MVDVNVYQENLFHTKMMVNDFQLDDYLFLMESERLTQPQRRKVKQRVQREMSEIFYGRNLGRNPES
jgi:S-adenosylmethionine decarboxylase